MLLSDVVNKFATETFTDAFDSETEFRGKLNPFAEVMTSGSSAQRRILETPSDVSIPVSRVIVTPASQAYLVSNPNADFWDGGTLRFKYSIFPVSEVGSVGSVGSVLSGAVTDQQVYFFPYSVSRDPDEEARSDYLLGYSLFFPKVKSFSRSSIAILGSQVFRLTTDTWIDGAGFAVAESTLLEDPVQTLNIQSGRDEYDPDDDSYSSTNVSGVSCFVEPLRNNYDFVNPAFTDIEPGDKAISVLKSAATIGVNDMIGDYKVSNIRDSGTWVTCQCRDGS